MLNSIIVLVLSLLLSSCGGGSGSTDTPNTGQPNSTSSSAPTSLSNTIIEMTVDNLPSSELGFGFPMIGNKIINHFGDYSTFYFQSEQYGAWEYYGEFEYEKEKSDEAHVDITVESTRRAYSIDYEFDTGNSGTWEGKFNDGLLTLNGSFTTKPIPDPRNYDFQGTIEDEQTFDSSITNVAYQYQVYLPVGYHENNDEYSVIYATDGQWEFWKIAHIIETSQKDIILVAITQGPNDRRLIDYALPGSNQYLEFLKQEMLPLIESQYRIDQANRAIAGFSWGGLLVRHALYNEISTPLFKNFISIDGSYWHEDNIYRDLEEPALTNADLADKVLYLSGATRAGNDANVRDYYQTINGYNISGLSVYFESFEVEHSQSPLISIKDALIKLYP